MPKEIQQFSFMYIVGGYIWTLLSYTLHFEGFLLAISTECNSEIVYMYVVSQNTGIWFVWKAHLP